MTTLLLIVLTALLAAGVVGVVSRVLAGDPFVTVWWCFGGAEALFWLLGVLVSAVASSLTE